MPYYFKIDHIYDAFVINCFSFLQGSITLTIQGSVKSDINIKVRDIRRAFEAGNFYISVPNNGSTKIIYPEEINVFGEHAYIIFDGDICRLP